LSTVTGDLQVVFSDSTVGTLQLLWPVKIHWEKTACSSFIRRYSSYTHVCSHCIVCWLWWPVHLSYICVELPGGDA